MPLYKQFENIRVVYASRPPHCSRLSTFKPLISKLGSHKGRQFFGVSQWDSHDFWACIQLEINEVPRELGLPVGVIPGGRYAYKKFRGPVEELQGAVNQTLEQLAGDVRIDRHRPIVEHYRRHDRLTVYIPELDPIPKREMNRDPLSKLIQHAINQPIAAFASACTATALNMGRAWNMPATMFQLKRTLT